MTPTEATKLLEVAPDATPEQIEARFLELRRKLEDKIAKAPTPGLQAKYRDSLAELTAAFEMLTLAADSSALPVLRQDASPAGGSRKAGSASTSSAAHRPPPAAKRSGGREFVLVAVIAVAVLGAGGWWVMKTRAENAEKERLAAAAKVAAEQKAAADKAKEVADKAKEAADKAERDRLLTQAQARLAELNVRFDAAARSEQVADRELSDLQSLVRDLRGSTTPDAQMLSARLRAQERLMGWMRETLPAHPARIAKAKAEQFVSARSETEITPALDTYATAITQMQADIAKARQELLAVTGPVPVTSDPSGMAFEVADAFGRVFRGNTPATLDLALGSASVKVIRSEWPDLSRSISVQPQGNPVFSAEFAAGTVAVTSTPAGAEVWRKGQRLGTTPLQTEVPPGRQEFELRLTGYKPLAVSGTVVAKQVSQVDGTLPSGPRAGQPWENSLGQKFVPVPGTSILFCIWEARVQDFEAFVKETGHDATQGMYSDHGDGYKQQGDTWRSPGFAQGATHPVVGVNEADAKAFCVWLTQKERREGWLTADQEYRLPTDSEWSAAAGPDEFPWGNQWPPPRGAGNYADETAKRSHPSWTIVNGYDDGYNGTAPVGSFSANRFGIFDLSGNVWERVDDRKDGLRGSALNYSTRERLASAFRLVDANRDYNQGFRVVCTVGSAR